VQFAQLRERQRLEIEISHVMFSVS